MNIQDEMIMMKDGQVMIIRNDAMTPLEEEITLSHRGPTDIHG